MKNHFLYIAAIVFLNSCGGDSGQKANNYQQLEGLTQGTSFHITYKDSLKRDFQLQVDSLLKVIDQSMSTYIDNSLTTIFNNSDSGSKVDEHLLKVFWKSNEVHYLTDGCFDPGVKPLIDFWGFGSSTITVMESIDSAAVDSLLEFTSIEKIKVFDKEKNEFLEFFSAKKFGSPENYVLVKTDKRARLDFNAIAQGYTVDLICDFFEQQGIDNYLVEIGGEVRVKGTNSKGSLWKIGIDKPMEEKEYGRPLKAVMTLKNKSVATSGNYRKFYEKDGIKYSHTISAKTGYPVQHKILSATVIADDCMTADAYATAFMIMGHEKAITFLEEHKELQAYLIFSDDDGNMKSYLSPELESSIEEKES